DAHRAALRARRAEPHDAVAPDDVVADLGANPIGGVGHEPALFVGVEARGRLEKPEVALLNEGLDGNAPATILTRDAHHEGQARGDQPVSRAGITSGPS